MDLKKPMTFEEIKNLFEKKDEIPVEYNGYHPGGFVVEEEPDDIPVVKVAAPPKEV